MFAIDGFANVFATTKRTDSRVGVSTRISTITHIGVFVFSATLLKFETSARPILVATARSPFPDWPRPRGRPRLIWTAQERVSRPPADRVEAARDRRVFRDRVAAVTQFGQVSASATASTRGDSGHFVKISENSCTSKSLIAMPVQSVVGCAKLCLSSKFCVAFIFLRQSKSCQTLPRLLTPGEMTSGSCYYFVAWRCRTAGSCSPEFSICWPDLPERRFLLNLQKKDWSGQDASCKSKGGELAEFPGHLEIAFRNFFPMLHSLMERKWLSPYHCSYFSATNVQCQVFIGARVQSDAIIRWVRSGTQMETTWSDIGFEVGNYLRYNPQTDGICFNTRTNKSMIPARFYVKEQWRFSQLGLCECLL